MSENYQHLLESLCKHLEQLTDTRAGVLREISHLPAVKEGEPGFGLAACRAETAYTKLKKTNGQLSSLGEALAAVARAAEKEAIAS
jgi:hypothetical protein